MILSGVYDPVPLMKTFTLIIKMINKLTFKVIKNLFCEVIFDIIYVFEIEIYQNENNVSVYINFLRIVLNFFTYIHNRIVKPNKIIS
jgi:hypothetical protein